MDPSELEGSTTDDERVDAPPAAVTVVPVTPIAMTARPLLPPPRPDTAWPDVDDEERKRHARRQRWILVIGYGLVAFALGEISYTAWLLGNPQTWVVWIALTMAPAVLTVLAALTGWRAAMPLAVFSAAWYLVVAIVALALQPSLGLPQVVTAIAAVAVTAAAWATAPAEVQESAGEPPLVNTAG